MGHYGSCSSTFSDIKLLLAFTFQNYTLLHWSELDLISVNVVFHKANSGMLSLFILSV